MRLSVYVLSLISMDLSLFYSGGQIGMPTKESLSLQAYLGKKILRASHRVLITPGHIKFKRAMRSLRFMLVTYHCVGKYEHVPLV
jgi:hypothetical protein